MNADSGPEISTHDRGVLACIAVGLSVVALDQPFISAVFVICVALGYGINRVQGNAR